MISTTLSRKWIAACVAVAVWSVYSMVVLASPGAKASAELSVSGLVTVNGQKAISGGTLFSDSKISTGEKSSALVSLGKLGRVDLEQTSDLHLKFSNSSISGLLETGSANVSTLPGVTVNLSTKDGMIVVDGNDATSFTVTTANGSTVVTTTAGVAELRTGNSVKRISAGESATAGLPNPMPQGGSDEGLSGGALAVLLIAAGGAVAAIIYAALHNNDLNFNGTVVVVSPTK